MTLEETLNEQFSDWYTKNKQVAKLLTIEVLTIETLPHFTVIKLDKIQRFEKAHFNASVTVNNIDNRVCKNF